MLGVQGALTIGTGGEITTPTGGYSITDGGFLLDGHVVGKGGASPASSLSWTDLAAPGVDRAGLITTFVADTTPSLDESTLWLAGGYDNSLQRGVGNVLIEGGSIILDGQDIPIKNHDTTTLATGEVQLDVTAPVMEITEADNGTRICRINLVNQTEEVGMQITVMNGADLGDDFGWRDQSQTTFTSANIEAENDSNFVHRAQTAITLTRGYSGWYVSSMWGN